MVRVILIMRTKLTRTCIYTYLIATVDNKTEISYSKSLENTYTHRYREGRPRGQTEAARNERTQNTITQAPILQGHREKVNRHSPKQTDIQTNIHTRGTNEGDRDQSQIYRTEGRRTEL